MTQGERIREIRKALNLTLEKFGDRLGVAKTTISRIETGVNNVTEQMQKSICREFHVSYAWLVNGDGEMFSQTDHAIKVKVDEIMEGENEFHKELIKSIVDLRDDDIKAIQALVNRLYESTKKAD